MTEEQKDVPQAGAEPVVEPSATEPQQPVVGSEPVETPTGDGKDYKTIAENLSKALREEREKHKIEPVTQPQPVVPSEDETVKRFLATEANATIAVKLQTDPSFKDRVELVQDYVAKGYDINMADKLAKADIMDQILSAKSETKKPVIPNQIKPTATQERIFQKENSKRIRRYRKEICSC